MRMSLFNKIEKTVICRYCNTGSVPETTPLRRCDDCKKNNNFGEVKTNITIGSRTPAAIIIEDETTTQHYVDKFGKEVRNPGYDLELDPRGYKLTQSVKSRNII